MVNSDARQRRRIARLVSKLTGTADWHRTRALLHRYPELTSEAAEDRLAALAERADQERATLTPPRCTGSTRR